MRDWFMFDKMITPILLRIGFVLAVLGALAAGIASAVNGEVLRGIGIAVFGIVGARISSELLILLFRIHENLVEINHSLKSK
ncbi:hypothetical protein PTE30175_03271 [Pandoraea terrae]|uniref:DUF4282 domain-containing protein n=1 Tax=Pandoraea terrae TaxID=1537710 RepID=A0A5E4WLB9_9BURK|nr:DUF4282 domain-containing protein [Pandoraea terrae]VVE25301.1 hypothetical protein PTE30175_03271 [Pandoraea terrae]